MKQLQFSRLAILALICLLITTSAYSLTGKSDKKLKSDATVNKEIVIALERWNDAAKTRNVDQFMVFYDNFGDIMAIGSDSGEVFKGREQIENWITKLFSYASFSWDMKRIDIDHNGNTAWVFMDGFMIVTNDKGKSAKFPYRFTGILVKSKNSWKWRFFNGSVPGGHKASGRSAASS